MKKSVSLRASKSLHPSAYRLSLWGALLAAAACSSKADNSASGGGTSTGGTLGTGGNADTGGSTASGGSNASGGDNSSGGSTASGGSNSTGGSSASGGSNANGGSAATGGGGSGSISTGGGPAEGGTRDASSPADAAMGVPTQDGAIVGCIRGIYGFHVLRADGIALYEPSVNNEHVIVETTTALPLGGIRAVQGGFSHGCAALDDGTVACWQTAANSGNAFGQLGNGTLTASAVTFRSTPVLSAANTPLSNVVGFATGAESTNALNSTCALTADNKLWCWGDLTWIVNDGTALRSPYAQAITVDGMNALTGVAQAAFATTGACALVQGSPNSVWCWGYNASGELAQGDTVNRQYPIKVLGLSDPKKVIISNSAGPSNTVCVQDGDNIKCWGNNQNGTVGANSTTNPVQSPTLVVTQNGATALAGIADLEPGTTSFGVLRTDGTLWVWGFGYNRYAANYGLTNVLAIAYTGGFGGNGPRFLTSDNVYHNGMTSLPVNCGVLQ